MKILFIHEIDYLAKVIYEIHEFPEHLASRGHDITFIDFPESLKTPNWSSSGRNRFIHGRVLPNVTLRLVSPFVPNGGILGRLLATATFIPALLRQLIWNRPDVIALYAVPTYGWQTIFLAKCLGVPVMYRALDVSHEINESIFNPLIRLAERYIYKRAQHLSANNQAIADYCISTSGRRLSTEVNLPLIDVQGFKNLQHDYPYVNRKDLGIPATSQVICYMGSFFYFSGLPAALRRFRELADADRGLFFLLIGGGEQDAELRQIVMDLGLQGKVLFTGFVPFAELPAYLKLADVAINPMEIRQVSNLALPHKVIQYVASGVPAISTRLTGLYSVFGEKSGIIWADTPEETVDKALEVIQSGNLRAVAMKQSKFLSQTFALDSVIDSFTKSLAKTHSSL